jgi:ribosomal protein S10
MSYVYNLNIKSYEKEFLHNFLQKIKILFEKSNVAKKVVVCSQQIKKRKKTVLSSPHVNKKAKEQFEKKAYSKVLKHIPNHAIDNETLLILHRILNQKAFNFSISLKVKSF